MSFSDSLFYLFGFISIFSALLVVFNRNPIYSVLFLIVTFFAIAGEYILLNAQFLAVVHIIVYAGAIMVLFLFVLMLLNLNKEEEVNKSILWKFIGVLSGGILCITLLASLRNAELAPITLPANESSGLVKNLGKSLFTDYLVPFEISSILFLAAMVGAVMIGKHSPTATE